MHIFQHYDIYLKQFSIFSDPNRVKHPKDQKWLRKFRALPAERVITVGYMALVNIEDFNTDATYFNDEIIGELTREGYYEKIWAKVNDIPDLAFDHNNIVEEALKYLKKELNHELSQYYFLKILLYLSYKNCMKIFLERRLISVILKANFKRRVYS